MTHSPVAGPCRTMLVVEVKEDVGANGGGKVEGRKGPDGPGVGGSLIIRCPRIWSSDRNESFCFFEKTSHQNAFAQMLSIKQVAPIRIN